MPSLETLEIAGVPLLLQPPVKRDRQAPMILFWHGFGSPNGEAAIAEAFPLKPIDAWKAYLGLPLFGKRSAGDEDLMRRQMEDYVLQLVLPVVQQAVQELPKVVEGLQRHCGLDSQFPLGLFGFSAGGLAALLALLESPLPIQAVVLAGVTKNLSAAVATYERLTRASYDWLKLQYPGLKPNYEWSEESEVARARLDFISRSKEIAQRTPLPAILFVHGAQDEAFKLEEVETLHHHALKTEYRQINHAEKISLKVFQHLSHAIDLVSNSSPEKRVDVADMERTAANWFQQFLVMN